MIAAEHQTILDLAIIASGGIESAIDICNENNISITDGLEPCVDYVISNVVNPKIVQYFAILPQKPATLDTSLLDGINYDRIECEFTVR